MAYPNISKNPSFMLSKVINNISFWYQGWNPEDDALNFGLVEKGSVKLKAVPKIVEMIDGSQYQLGYDFEFEIVSLQYYSLYEYEKFMNKVCTFNLQGIHTYIKDIVTTIELDAEPGAVKGVIKFSGKKFVEKIRDVIDGNPWGTLASPPWPATIPTEALPIGWPLTLGYGYEYTMSQTEPLIINIVPSNPFTNVVEFADLILVDHYHKPIEGVVSACTLKYLEPSTGTWESCADTPAFDMVNGLWVAKYSLPDGKWGAKIRVEWDLS